jgi:hypothetical protein
VLDLSDGETVRSGAVVVATAVTYLRLGVPSLGRLVEHLARVPTA